MNVVTRIGISPFSTQQHIGVYRSFLLSVFIAKHFGGKTFLRIDDTNPQHKADMNLMVDDMNKVIDTCDLSDFPADTKGRVLLGKNKNPAIVESFRSDLYNIFVQKIIKTDLIFFREGAIYLDARRYIEKNGDNISVPYNSNNNRQVSITKSLPKGAFPIMVGGNRTLWHLTSVVDDILLGVTHIVRACDKIDNQVPQMILYKLLEYPAPKFYYTKIILNGESSPPTLCNLEKEGITIKAVRSYLYSTITGNWNKIYLSLPEALNDFDPASIKPGNINYDMKKLSFIQKHIL